MKIPLYKKLDPLSGKKPSKIVILMHGLGSNSADMFDLIPYIQPHMPDTIFISSNAIEPHDIRAYGYQWFSMLDRSLPAMQSQLELKNEYILNTIDTHLKTYDLNYKDLILIGFSQGAMAILHTILFNNINAQAAICFCGPCIPPKRQLQEPNLTPICMISGEVDDIVTQTQIDRSVLYLKQHTKTLESYVVKNLSHSIDHTSLETANNFIKKHCYK